MNTQIHPASDLEKYLPDYLIFMDTCSIMQENTGAFFSAAAPLLQKYQKKLIVPTAVQMELQKLSETGDAKARLLASNGKRLLRRMEALGVLEFRGEKDDGNFADHVFEMVFARHRLKHNLLLITQDTKLAKELTERNNSEAIRGKRIVAMRLRSDGSIMEWSFTQQSSGNTAAHSRSHSTGKTPPLSGSAAVQGFRTCRRVTATPDTKRAIRHIPSLGETVYIYDKKTGIKTPVMLKKEIATGGEGVVFETNTSSVAKIYLKDCNTERRYLKLQRMLDDPLCFEGICSPEAGLYNAQGEFVGYLMPRAQGTSLQGGLFFKPVFQKDFPNWKKRDLVELCITILRKIRFLHQRNVILGDINPNNILFVSPTEVYFVDTDSYQIEDIPCPVGTVNFTAPEIQGKQFAQFLRDKSHDNFAIATLLFMIMLPGKPPYAQQGGGDQMQNVISMNFSYPLGENSNKLTPDGAWRFMWSHLTYEIKSAFYHTFRKDGMYAAPDKRLSVSDWLPLFEKYLGLLDSGKLGEADPMSEEIYPTEFKRSRFVTYVNCPLCHHDYPEDQTVEGYCKSCLSESESYPCKRCGKEMKFTNYHKYVKGIVKPYELCPECHEQDSQTVATVVCSDCGRLFYIQQSEADFYLARNMQMPKRCKSCRQHKKASASPADNGSTGFFANLFRI